MKCDKCGKEFQTYRGICPYCHSKNEKDYQEQPNIKYTPVVNSNPPTSDKPRNPSGSTPSPSSVRAGKSSDKTLKYLLVGGFALLVVLSMAAMAQSFLGGSSLSVSAPISSVTPEETIPPLYTVPIASTTQPKITYSESKAGTLSPYGGDSDSVSANPGSTRYTAPGYPSTPNTLPQESTSPVSDSRSTVVYVTSIPTTIAPVSSPPKIVEPVSPPPKDVKPPTFQKGMVLSKMDKGEYLEFYDLVISVRYIEKDEGYWSGEQWIYTIQRLYEYPVKDGWYLVSTDQKIEGDETDIRSMEYSRQPTGEILNVDTVPLEPRYISVSPRFQTGDIVKVKGDDGNWNTYLIVNYIGRDRFDYYETEIIIPKEDGAWGYINAQMSSHHQHVDKRKRIDASSNSLVDHLNELWRNIQAVNPFPPTFTPTPITPVQSRATTVAITTMKIVTLPTSPRGEDVCDLTLHSWETSQSPDGNPPSGEGKVWILVDLSVQNKYFKNGLFFSPFSVKLIDEVGVSHQCSKFDSYNPKGLFGQQVIPFGESRRGKLFYEVYWRGPIDPSTRNTRYQLRYDSPIEWPAPGGP